MPNLDDSINSGNSSVRSYLALIRKDSSTLIFFYKHNNYKHTYGKKCEKISIILSIMLR